MKKVAFLAIIITSMIAAYPAVSKAMMLGTCDFVGSGGSSSFLTELEFRLEPGLIYSGPLFVISWVAGPEHVGDTLFVSAETDAYFEIAAYVLSNGVYDHIAIFGGGGGTESTDCSFFTKVPGVETEYCDFHGCNITAISLTVNALTLDHPTDSWTNHSYDVTFTVWGDPPVPKPAMIYYVDADASGANNGSSWANAYNYLQDALIAASRGDEIRVAEGIYTPDRGAGMTSGDRRATFQPIIGVTIKGGYAGFGEPEPNDCDIELFKTILSGDLAGNDVDVVDPLYLLENPSRAENSYHVVIEKGTDETAVLDGFTISAGNGGGMYNFFCKPTVINCTFSKNSAKRGGGMFNWSSKPTLTNCTFSRNSAGYGGGMYNWISSPTLTNCIFTANLSTSEGAGIYNYNEKSKNNSPILTNCTFHENSASNGNALAFDSNWHKYPSSVQITNCIFWDGGNEIWNNDNSTVTITHSDVQGGWLVEGNINADPCFVKPGYWDAGGVWIDGDYCLSVGSPCIDAGTDAGVYEDMDGNIRPFDFPGVDNNGDFPDFDMGAYETVLNFQGRLTILPRTINYTGQSQKILALMRLPENVVIDDIDSYEKLILYPGGIPATAQKVVPISTQAQSNIRIYAVFDKAEIFNAVDNYGDVELTVVGRFISGDYFYGKDTVRIISGRTEYRIFSKIKSM